MSGPGRRGRRRPVATGVATLAAVAALAGCSGSGGEGADPAPTATATAPTGPSLDLPSTEPPSILTAETLVAGTGEPAVVGDTLTVRYVGRGWTSGAPIGAWGAPPFTFELGAGEVISGWDSGLRGIQVGEQRRLVVPAALALGDTFLGPLGSGDTLLFVVELVAREPAP